MHQVILFTIIPGGTYLIVYVAKQFGLSDGFPLVVTALLSAFFIGIALDYLSLLRRKKNKR